MTWYKELKRNVGKQIGNFRRTIGRKLAWEEFAHVKDLEDKIDSDREIIHNSAKRVERLRKLSRSLVEESVKAKELYEDIRFERDELNIISNRWKNGYLTMIRVIDEEKLINEEEMKKVVDLEGKVVQNEIERDLYKYELDTIKKYMGNLKAAVRDSVLRFRNARLSLVSSYNLLVELGINPKTEERNGRYAFVNRDGLVTAMSEKAQNAIGYEPGEINYQKIINTQDLVKLGEVEKDTVLPILYLKTKGISKPLRIKDVVINPMRTKGVYLGSVIDFKEMGRLEKIREYIFERREKKRIDRLRESIAEARNLLHGI
jgi:hypothetical protein